MSIFSSLIGPAAEIVGKFVQDKDKAAELAHEMSAQWPTGTRRQAMLAQIEVNKAEAARKLVSGVVASTLRLCLRAWVWP